VALSIDEIIEARKPGTTIDSRVDALKDLAETQTDATAWGDTYNHGIALLVLHWLELDGRTDTAGNITAKKEGQLSLSYGGQTTDDALASTVFGAEYIGLRRLVFGPVVRGQNEMPKIEGSYP